MEKNGKPIPGLKDIEPEGYQIFEGKLVRFLYGGPQYGLVSSVKDGFVNFTKRVRQKLNETGAYYVLEKVTLRVPENQIQAIEEVTQEEIDELFSVIPRNKQYLGQWVHLLKEEVAGKLCYVTDEEVRLRPSVVSAFNEKGHHKTLEEKIPTVVPNKNLIIQPITKESVMNYIKRSEKDLEEKVKESKEK